LSDLFGLNDHPLWQKPKKKGDCGSSEYYVSAVSEFSSQAIVFSALRAAFLPLNSRV
jgi:hypothetical protein